MMVYFADRQLNILGQASTKLPNGLTVIDDNKTEDVETGVSVFECVIPYTAETRLMVEEYAEVGNYILLKGDDEDKLYTIIESESDTKNQELYIYVEDDGMDLLNEVVGAYQADKAYPISHYINKYAADAGFEIGINEVANLSRKLSWDGEATATERIASVATQFDGCEISYSFEIDGLNVVKKHINIYKERGQDIGITLRLNQDIDRIITKKSIANLATALQPTGGTPEDENLDDDVEPVPITLKGYSYDDGDFYVDSDGIVKSREALKKWSRYLWKTDDTQKSGGHIVKQYSYDTLSQATLCSRTITELKKVRDMEVNYEVEISKLPDNVKIGDRVNIVDDAGELYVSTRILQLESSEANDEHKATLGEFLIKNSGISQKVAELAAQFAKASVSAARALAIANNAKSKADEAQEQANSALTDAQTAQQAAEAAQTAANTAQSSASDAQEKANAAQSAVEKVEESVTSIETTVTNAQTAADNAHKAAQTAQQKADEAAQSAQNALADAAEAKAAVEDAKSAASDAQSAAEAAQSTAETAKTDAATAKQTAEAAKADAEQAEKDIAALGEELETVTTTMQTDYARKTELTEATASLQSQISQNSAEISSTVSKVATIDETANNAATLAQSAQTAADAAQTQADQATADAQAAQTAADNAAQAAANAQSEADTAKAAAETAQSVADKAEADLEAAKADLATVSSRVDATEEEITAAQNAVTAAQTAADKAKTDADAAAKKAASAQSTADTAVTNAANAQTAADNAASAAALAQKTADEAKGNAAAAQAKADEAATTAANAQATANTAKTNAANAQAKADQAAADAATAQQAADDADARAAQAEADLATAQQNLANVTSRVDATEEEVEAAKAAVDTAQAAADKAQEEAEAAQATADTAKANAATAQTAANNAKTAADNAQKAADEAQKAADDAQAAVGALAVRVTTAETKITQNSEQIALMATKTEVTQTLGGYYTKAETEAAIKLESDAITSSVSSTYATKEEVESDISDVTDVAEAAQSATESVTERVDVAESTIQQLFDNISMLVKDSNGESLMEQTSDGWTFSTSEIQNQVDATSQSLAELVERMGSSEAAIDILSNSVDEFGVIAEYIHIGSYTYTDEDGNEQTEPSIDLFETDTGFKLKITNTRILFTDGATELVTIDSKTKSLVTPKAAVESELQIGSSTVTNLVPKAIDTDGSIYADGNGYLDGYRLNSSGTVTAYSGASVTGFIPARLGMTFTARGIGWDNSEYGTKYLCFYDSSFTLLEAVREDYWREQNTCTDDGDIVGAKLATQWSVDLSATAYIRISGSGSGANYVVTITDGVWVWKKRSNGNLGLTWKEVDI